VTAQDVTVLEASIEETLADRATKRTFRAYFEIGRARRARRARRYSVLDRVPGAVVASGSRGGEDGALACADRE